MSLKAVHICFILLSIGLTAGFGVWALNAYLAFKSLMNLFLGVSSWIGCAGLAVYFVWFLFKMKKLSPS
jgi:hypothetical protein